MHSITRSASRRFLGLTIGSISLLLGVPAQAHPPLLPPTPASPATTTPTWRGEFLWHLGGDEPAGAPAPLRLAFVELPNRDYLVIGTLTLDDSELAAVGSARWRADRLVLDLTLSGGIHRQPPDAEKRALFPATAMPEKIDSTGFAMLRAELDGPTLSGPSQRYQTNVLTGNRVQGPVQGLAPLTFIQKIPTTP